MRIRCLKCNDIIEAKNLHDCISIGKKFIIMAI